jgi:hypothetical protein
MMKIWHFHILIVIGHKENIIMSQEIVVIQQMGDALRNTGYKSIESAMSEIIDNSIEAEAKDIFIIVSEKTDSHSGRKHVDEIAFLDNGYGMDDKKLSSCLGIGFSTRTSRKKIGRFGVGLPQSSLYACPQVDVYSWQNGYENCKKVFLDIDAVKDGTQTVIEDPEKTEIPKKYRKFLNYNIAQGNRNCNFKQSGTLVIWKNCDRVVPKSVHFLFRTLEFSLGQKFRHLIKKGTHNIRLIPIENEDVAIDIMPNDPLFTMKPNLVLGDPNRPGQYEYRNNTDYTEPLFEPFSNEQCPDGIINYPVKYVDPKTGEILESTVKITFTKVRDIFYDQTALSTDPGSTPVGKKHVKKLEGISIVRADREIDFGQFDFYSNLDKPEHRWWGCEIAFTPELDEAFGVANNKQYVELKRVDPEDYFDEPVQPMWLQLYSIIYNTINTIYKENKKTRAHARTVQDVIQNSTNIINEAEKGNDESQSASQKAKTDSDPKELENKTAEQLKKQGVENPTTNDVATYLSNKVNIVYEDLGRTGGIFDYEFSLGTCLVKINTSHIFYKKFLENVMRDPDTKTAFELFIASLVKAIDETELRQSEQNDNLIAMWNEKLRRYINEQQNYAKSN